MLALQFDRSWKKDAREPADKFPDRCIAVDLD
jgi:hypothetical protein